MEMAIATMLIIFALCTMLLIVAEMSGVLNRRTTDTASARVMADRIGEDFYKSHKQNVSFDPTRYSSVYSAVVETIDEDTERLLVYNKGKNSRPLLCVDVVGNGSAAKIVRWSYNYNDNPESAFESE